MRLSFHKYPPVLPDIRQWPVYLLSKERDHFIRQLRTSIFQSITDNGQRPVRALIERALYLERSRIHDRPWKVDPPDERAFWTKVRKRLGTSPSEGDREVEYELLQEIIHRYAQEIVGTFNRNTFLFARRFLTLFFGRLLQSIGGWSILSRRSHLQSKLNVVGEFEMVRKLMEKGTVIIVPTHSSNLDSILVGYMLDAILGLPSFSYGAGLNLYNTGYIAYFMNRLGAYRVDRRKKNLIYLETLKSYSRLTLERGVNSIFFPGGTRSRSGIIEPKLKIGLLSTAIEAQRSLLQHDRPEKVFIVPLNISYHFVLEAGSLVNEYLREEGKEKYIVSSREDSRSIRKTIKFIWKLMSKSSQVTFSISRPLDVLGNAVDEGGNSFDHQHRQIDVRDYFRLGTGISADAQRESQYSKTLAEKVVECYYRDYVVLSSHLVACVAFDVLKSDHANLDLFSLIKLPEEDYIFDSQVLVSGCEEMRLALLKLEAKGRVKIAPSIKEGGPQMLMDGIKNMGVFHTERPIFKDTKGRIRSESFKLLYFYHNRLDGYRKVENVEWDKLQVSFAG
ncbi:MAG: 1-acyl-sn-glycerol-3-phosphate acyltransferase [Saprospiraceae bacterium]|nr:1-acyl-sn-glycerol-3-phosphate acyltransferase [Saprospiraceae bacterium]